METQAPVKNPKTPASALEQLIEINKKRQAKSAGFDETVTEGDVVEVRPLIAADVVHGVTVGTLAQVFRMDSSTVKKRLRDCPPIATRKVGHVYDMAVAASFLVKPVFDPQEYLRTMKPSELPTHLQEAYWSAMRKRQEWEKEARELWQTSDVMDVFGSVFKTIKTSLQLWPDTVEQATGLSPKQRDMLVEMCDALQRKLHQKLIDLPKQSQTRSQVATQDAMPVMGEPTVDEYYNLV